jgi:O-antigen/teichoic acid export membrane protein
VSGAARREESTAAHGARWMVLAMVVVGLANYGYAVLLTHLLSVAGYSSFAAGQSLILWASTMAIVSVPWVLAQAMVRARSDEERHAAVRFAKLVSLGSGCVAAVIVGAIATRFASPLSALALAFSIFVIFLGTATTGWLQGGERLRALSALTVIENVLKNSAGVLLVVVARWGEAGALSAFGIGALALLVRWPRIPRGHDRPWRTALANRDLWHRAGVIAGAQGLVSLFVAIDAVMVELLPGDRALAASYQASAAISRIPLYLAGAVALAFFPSLSRRSSGGVIAARAVRMYAAMALPVAAVVATVPAPILSIVFPGQYSAVATLLKFTAVTGIAAGGITLVTAFFQAADDYSVLWWLGAGLVGYIGALLEGWRLDGIIGLAAGGALAATITLALMGYRLVRSQGREVLSLIPVMEPAAAAVALILLRPHPWLWVVVASVAGLRAANHFVRPGARHARAPRWVAAGHRKPEESVASLLIAAVWLGAPPKITDAELQQALELARRNRVEGRLARAYRAELPAVLTEARAIDGLFALHLGQVTGCFRNLGIPAVLMTPSVLLTARKPGGRRRASIELIVPERHWARAMAALADRYVHSTTYQLGQHISTMLYPPVGPELHLHTGAAWFGLPVVSTDRLLSRARWDRRGLLVLAPADYLRVWFAQALFHDLVLDLSSLMTICKLLQPAVITDARTEASREGWRAGFEDVLAAASSAIDQLDRGLPVSLPVPLPLTPTLRAAAAPAPYWQKLVQPAAAGSRAAVRVAAAPAGDRREQRMVAR